MQFTATEFQLRFRETHCYHRSLFDGTNALRDHVATKYGVVQDSTLNSSKYFHVTEGLVPDVMHDVLEGCAPYVVNELLKYLDQNKPPPFHGLQVIIYISLKLFTGCS